MENISINLFSTFTTANCEIGFFMQIFKKYILLIFIEMKGKE